MKKASSLAAGALGLIFACLCVAPTAFAATSQPGSGQALEIAPPLITLNVNPGQTVQTQIKLRDVSKTDLLVTNQINDFVAAGEDGTPKIITGDDSDNPFSMKDWITPLPSFTLSPQQIHNLSITIQVPSNASPGGHYGVIRFTGTPPQLKGQGVSLSASLGALVLLTVSGKITHNLSVQQFITTKIPPTPDPNNPKPVSTDMKPVSLFESAPINFEIKLKNTGNIQEGPVGHIVITNMFGKAVAGVNVNLERRNVLPNSVRMFQAKLDSSIIGKKKLFGRYHAVLTVKYGSNNDKTLTTDLTFWVIPWKLIVGIIIALIVAFFALRFLLRRYNRRIIAKAGGGYQQPSRAAGKPKKSRRLRHRK